MSNTEQPAALTDKEWSLLLTRIAKKRCTPFLGAEATGALMPPRSEIARRWAEEFSFPLDDPLDLAKVSQFVATTVDGAWPREKILEEIRKVGLPDFEGAKEPHHILAELPLEVYITTDYHDFMLRALKSKMRDPRQDMCRWNETIRSEKSVLDEGFQPTVANPVVFHLYGHAGVSESLVLTEDNYLDFLVDIAKNEKAIPARIQQAFSRASLVFLGYRLNDLEFRVLLRTLATVKRAEEYRHVAVQVVHVGTQDESEEQLARLAKIQEYFSSYCEPFSIKTYWGTTDDFLVELKQRWDQLPDEAKRPPS
jgi:hypothetical protein